MAIAFAGSADLGNNGGTTNSLTTAYTVNASSNLLVVTLQGDLTTGFDDITSVTYNGVSLTLATKHSQPTNASNVGRFMYAYYLLRPATGSNNVVINCTNNHYIIAMAADYSGVAQSGQPDATASTDGSVTTVTGNITTITRGDWTIGFCAGYANGTAPTAGAGTTLRTSNSLVDFCLVDSNGPIIPAGATSLTVNWASGPGYTVSIIITAFAPALVEWGGDTPNPVPRRTWRPRLQPDEVFLAPPTFVEWGDELRGRQMRVPWRSKILNPDEFINNPTQFPAPPWVLDLDVPQRRRVSWRGRQSEDLIIIPVAAVVTPANWGDIEQYVGPKQRPRWHRLTLVVDEWYPFVLPPPPPPSSTPFGPSYELQYGVLVSAYNTGQLTVQQFYYALYKLQWVFSGAVDWSTSFRPAAAPGDLPPQPVKPFRPTQMITNQADTVVDAATLVNTARALLSLGCPPSAFPAPYPPRWAFQFYGGR